MRIALGFSILFGAIFLASAAVTAAPLALSDHAAVAKTVGDAGSAVEQVGRRAKVRRYARGCNWQCTPYWRPYQYRYWQFYYPYGGPLF